jgi:hypothetical protein
MNASSASTAVTVIGSNGQISLGKQYAGRQVLVEEQEPGVWLVRTATVVPDNVRWLLQPEAAAELQRALDWTQANAADDGNVDAVLTRLADDGQSAACPSFGASRACIGGHAGALPTLRATSAAWPRSRAGQGVSAAAA